MNLGWRARVHFPAEYRGYSLVRTHGRIFAAPPGMVGEEMLRTGALFTHPAVLVGNTLEEIRALVDAGDPVQNAPQFVTSEGEHDILRHRGALYAVRRDALPLDLDLPEERNRGGAIRGESVEELIEKLAKQQESTPVEFAGWLPIFEYSGNCGRHPQFTHTAEPPAGYRFTCSAPRPRKPGTFWKKLGAGLERVRAAIGKAVLAARPMVSMFVGGPRVGVRTRLRVLGAMGRLYFTLRRGGARLFPTLKFLQTRHFHSQLLMARSRDLVFLTSMPYTYGQNPWMVEIEDPTTLFFPMIQNGRTGDLLLRESPYYPIVKTLLESDQCKGIITHMKSTAELVPTLFESETIRRKMFYTPLGVKLPTRWQRHDESRDPDEIHLLFINSWHQMPSNFYLRGGLDILEAFDTLRVRYPQLRLTIRSHIPALDSHYHRILESGWVRIINRFATPEEMADLHARSHIYLLPAARVHIVSLLQAMSYGLPVVASDGWGFEEYVEHDRNALVVRGRYGKVSWADKQEGVLREDYESMYTPDPQVVEGIIEAVSRLVEDRQLRARLGRTARLDVETKYNLANWNAGLQRAFDQAMNRSSREVNRSVTNPMVRV